MKVKLLTTISFFTYQLSISQTEKLLHGKVLANKIPLNKVEVINKTAKTSTRTNELGEFSILAKEQDSLLFFSKDYFFTRLKLTSENLKNNNLVINMITKAEELNEVVITAIKFQKVVFDAEKVNEINNRKTANDLTRYTGVNDGRIRYSANMNIPLGSSHPKEKYEVDNRFKKHAAAYCPPDFFTKNLNLNPDQKELFLEFCDADPKSKTLLEHPNVLATMDFLYTKNKEFQELK
ncbi:hypothetical protein L1276_001918 [Flavobacterium sp. HSC-32F16]|uniref:hypothetical protein n=1 Tax=Flavobacterium sp. HSC-32F16 TaxID=2910964 RepID=UPI0020A3ECE8|nr:hypothetical protein [Flavobacterium sp. HSC-32F16]MCP2026774.1 hypothetical protein [Flavobacterium sp. HSC-32F16]